MQHLLKLTSVILSALEIHFLPSSTLSLSFLATSYPGRQIKKNDIFLLRDGLWVALTDLGVSAYVHGGNTRRKLDRTSGPHKLLLEASNTSSLASPETSRRIHCEPCGS
jgi:hypothetical protein